MKALFLVGGGGTRLRPLTSYLPKPMIPVMGRPLLERTFTKLKANGVTDIVLSACYQPDKIIDHFGDGAAYGLNIEYVVEPHPLGTGGAIKNAEDKFSGPFLVFNADILYDMSLMDLLKTHIEKNAAATIAATEVEDPSAYGVIEYSENGRVTKFTEKPPKGTETSNSINAGVYVLQPEVLDYIEKDQPVSVEREVFPALLEQGEAVAIYRDNGYWLDIGTPLKYLQAHRDIFSGECGIARGDLAGGGVYISPLAEIDTSCNIQGPVFIGSRAKIGKRCFLGGDVTVGDGAAVGGGSLLRDVIIWPGTALPGGSRISHAVVASPGGQLKVFPFEDLDIPTKEWRLRYAH